MTKLDPKSIGEIMKEGVHFWIPGYQRGYRWTSLQITELLEDIWEFHSMDPKKDDVYWLQPIVVKKQEEGIEVIDGQQRLTTVLLIVKYIQSIIPFYEGTGYTLRYETRTGSETFITDIKNGEDSRNDNIDFYHMYNAYETIKNWFEQQSDKNVPIHIWQRLTDQVNVLWYELDYQYDGIDLFTRINIGKIPLTNAELIKALFLSKNNLGQDKDQHDYLKMKQIELATQWDTMETRLQEPDFWYFIQSATDKYENHIEWLFELVTDNFPQQIDIHTSYRTFHAFHEEIERQTDQGKLRHQVVEDLWIEIQKLYNQFNEWFDNRELYHLIGYLLASEHPLSVQTILKNAKSMKKDEFTESLYSSIRDRLQDWDITELNYDNNRKQVKDVLLLFNILTLQHDRHSKQRFDFDRYKNERWDIEHIHALQSQVLTKQEEQLAFVQDALAYIEDSDLCTELEEKKQEILVETMETEQFEKIQQTIVDYFGQGYSNHISNCTLLDSKTNRAYKNAIFPKKREEIISRDQTGVYIPIGTKNVFLKYYSKQTKQIHHWNQEDREAYMQNILEVLGPVITNHLVREVG
ncbi:DUF262 domain-containing protein [Gracilibacillus thailandensis]|uniref:DUF262 domain-containing protein n=1 Tax=Gracilibacillus thailandensis TaxID=563735 RepID=A0A6N7QZI5_9BACI|nr:DUF262 domain-containing protein [Gracilibacillus thailandensis]MRI66622.1 DUF262 domain-containing protein [Gracilibacillus thailandensis]